MARYWVLEACAFMDNGLPLFYRTIPREPVEIDDDVAATLGNKVRRVDPAPPVEKPVKEPVVQVGDGRAEEAPLAKPSEDRPDGIEGATGTILDGVLTVNQIRELEGLPPVPPKPKRKRKVEEAPDGDSEL